MADKTITQLTAIDIVAAADEFAVWDASTAASRKASATQVKALMTDVDINGLTAVGTLDVADSVAVYDASATANRRATVGEIKTLSTLVDITGLTSATPDVADTVPIYDASASANRKVTLSSIVALVPTGTNITGLPSVGGALDTADELILYDVSAGANKKTTVGTLATFVGGGGGGAMDITSLPDAGSSYLAEDFVPFYDLSATGNRKMSGTDLARRLAIGAVTATSPDSLSRSVLATSATADTNTRYTLQSLFTYLFATGIPALPGSAVPVLSDQIGFRDISGAGDFQAAVTTFNQLNAILDHGTMVGLGDNDHPQYALLTGANYTGGISVSGVLDAFNATAFDNGTGMGPRLNLNKNNNTTPAPGYISISPATGSLVHVWPDNSGIWRTVQGASPTNTTFPTAGVVLGAQTSSLDQKNIIGDPLPGDEVLALIAEGAAAVRRFTYKGSTYIDDDGQEQTNIPPYDGEEFSGVVVDYAGRYGTDRDEAHPNGKALNSINATGDLLIAVNYLAEQLALALVRIDALEAGA